jgi:hypothetical protein
MIFRVIPEENYKLIPLTHIPPDKEEEFWEKNKDTGLYIRADIFTAFPDCVKYDPVTKRVYNDLKCIHRKRVERKIREFESTTKQVITEYLLKMNWAENYYEGIAEISSSLKYLEENKDKYPECYEYVKKLHTTIEEIWLIEEDYEYKIKQSTSYTELQKYNVYEFINTEVIPRLEEVYSVYLQCEANKCCGR